jgi:hypothetical protein
MSAASQYEFLIFLLIAIFLLELLARNWETHFRFSQLITSLIYR